MVVTCRHLCQFMYPGCLTCLAITWIHSSGASLCFNNMNEVFLGSNRLHISCCCLFFFHCKWLKLASSWFAAIGKNPVELWILPKCSANFLQIPGHNTYATYISFGSEPKQSPYIYHKCLCIYKTTKTLGTFLHSQNFEIKLLHIATKRIQISENKFKPKSRKRKHLEFSRTLADLLTFKKPKYNLKTLLSLQNQSLGFVHPAQWQNADQKLNNPNVGKCLISIPKPTKDKNADQNLDNPISCWKKLDFQIPKPNKHKNADQNLDDPKQSEKTWFQIPTPTKDK